MTHSGTSSPKAQTPDSDWRRVVHFKNDLEYDYFMAVLNGSQKYVPNEEYYRIKDNYLGIVFHPESDNLQEKIKFKQLKSKNSSNSNPQLETAVDGMLRWNKGTEILQAIRKCNKQVFCKSPLYEQEVEIKQNENNGEDDWIDVLNFNEYYKKLLGENSCGIYCDPSIELRFDGNTTVYMRSRVAGCLYYTFVPL